MSTNLWAVVDGNPNSGWSAAAVSRGAWILLRYDNLISVSQVKAVFSPSSPDRVMGLGSIDADSWFEFPVGEKLNENFPLRYIWLIFPPSVGDYPLIIGEIEVLSGS